MKERMSWDTPQLLTALLVLFWLTPVAHGDGNPILGLAKSASTSQYLGDNVFRTEILLTVSNMGTAPLTGMSVQDDLANTFNNHIDWFEVEPHSLQSDRFNVNPNYNGTSDNELLASGNRLEIGQRATIRFQVRFRVTNDQGTYYNSARTESIECVPDISTNGSDPDPDANGQPTEREPTPIHYQVPPPQPLLGMAKRATASQYLGDNRFQVNIHILAENLGNTDLQELQITDDLQTTFGSEVASFQVVDGSITSSTLNLNPGFDGVADPNLLAQGNTLSVGTIAQVSFSVVFEVREARGEFFNVAKGVSIDCIPDRSTDGDDPDPNNDGSPTESEPTPITYEIPAQWVVGLAKWATEANHEQDRTFVTQLFFELENFGNRELQELQVTDDLASIFGDRVSSFEVVRETLRSDQLQINTEFNGSTDLNLLGSGNSLAIGASAQVSLQVRFTTLDDSGRFDNIASADCANCVEDSSTNGPDADPNGDGNPLESSATPITYELPNSVRARLGLAKSATFGEVTQGNERETTISLIVRNYGNATAQNIDIQDDLTRTFEAGQSFTVQPNTLASQTLQVNSDYDGKDQISLLTPGQSLAPGDSASLSYRVRFEVAPGGAELFNLATVTATNSDPDDSTNGDNPDVNADGLPSEAEPTPIPYEPLRVVSPEPPTSLEQLPLLRINVIPKPRTTRIGRVVGYTIRVANTITDTQPEVVVTDLSPTGFQPQLDEVELVRTGPDGRFDTADDVRRSIGARGTRLITYDTFSLGPLEAVRIEFPSRVTSAARLGPHPNKSTADSLISSRVTDDAIVDVIADVLFSRATILGKVFRDRNGDGLQSKDGSEEGVAAVRLITADGLIVQTDQHGRFHIADIEVNGRYGENYVIKLDDTSLPNDATSTNDTRQIVRVQPGGIGKANFGVQWNDRLGESNCCGIFQHLDQFSLTPTQKKLDVALRTIRRPKNPLDYELEFLVEHNYPDTVHCLQIALYSKGTSNPIFKPPVRSSTTKTTIAIPIPGQAYKRYGYSVFAYGTNELGQCDNLLANKKSTRSRADSTVIQYFDTPSANTVLPFHLPRRALNSYLNADHLHLPPSIPLLAARKFDSGYQLTEILSSDPALTSQRIRHSWDAVEQQRLQRTPLTPGNSLETTGYQKPPQVGGERGSVIVTRDSNGFDDQVVFTASGRSAELSCCEIDSALTSSLDTTQAVYAHKFENQHTSTLDLCLLPTSGNKLTIPEAKQLCWEKRKNNKSTLTVEPGNSIEWFSGQFNHDRPVHSRGWDAFFLFLRESNGNAKTIIAENFTGGYKVSRERVEDGIWTQPIVTAICGNVSSDIDITFSSGVAAHKLRSNPSLEVPAPAPYQSFNPKDFSNDLYLGIVDLSFGGSSASGKLASLAEQNDLNDKLFAEGRIAGYWRGNRTIGEGQKHNLNWVLQLDTTKDEFSALGKNLKRKDPRRLFRQLDVDGYYSTYGDDSTTFLDTNTQGSAYARVNYNNSEASWGNYRADFSSTEFSHFTRSLYGLNALHQSGRLTTDGEHRFSIEAFASEAQSVSAHMTFLATGGSLYYLKHTDIVMGSERLWIEIRRRGTQQVEERRNLVVGRDYEIDPLQGRILLSQPLAQLVREQHNPVVRHRSSEGDQVQLRVDYEYTPQGFTADEFTYGVRIKNWLSDELRIGATHVTDEQGTSDYALYGLDLLYQPFQNSYIAVEWADTKADSYQNGPLSLDGGLSLVNAIPNSLSDFDGQAFGIDAVLSMVDIGLGNGTLRAWHKQRDAGYTSSRFRVGPKVIDSGFEFDLSLNETTRLTGAALELNRQGSSRYRTARVQLSTQWQWRCNKQQPCWMLDIEGRYDNGDSTLGSIGVDLAAPYSEDRGTTVGIRLGRQLNEDTTLYGNIQTAFATDQEFGSGDRVAVGLNQRLNDTLALGIEVSDGQSGGAITGGIDYVVGPQATFNLSTGVGPGALTQASTRYHLTDGQELYGSYTMSPDRSDGARNMLALGQRRQINQRTHIYSESQFGHQGNQTSNGHLFGIDWRMADNLVIASTLQGSRVQTPLGDFDRLAVSIGASYATANLRLSSRIELRDDDGNSTQAKQYVISNAINYRLNENARLQGKLNAALIEDDSIATKLGRFVEFDLGYAFRPTQTDHLNALLRYSYLLDIGTEGQSETPGDERSHLLGAEGFAEVSQRVQLGAKLATRVGESRFTKGQGDWDEVKLGLAIARVLIRLGKTAGTPFSPNRFELQAEYRWLRDWAAQTQQDGLLLGLFHTRDSRNSNWTLSNTLRFGVGYNFSGFDDNLRRSSYRADGWFVDISAAF